MTNLSTNEKLACDLTVFTSEERDAHIKQAIRLRKAMIGEEHTDEGFKVYFRSDASPEEILAFALGEQRCCGFLQGANVYRETINEKERIVLSLKTSAEGASAWTGAFFALTPSSEGDKRVHAQGHSGKWVWPTAIAGAMCMTCVFPMLGAMLVARGLIPSQWNIGEGFYLLAGGITIGLWLALKRYRSARKNTKACGC